MNARHETAELARDLLVAQLRTDIHLELASLVSNWVHLERLVDSRQSVGLGFLTPEARKLLDRQTRDDRAAVRTNPEREIPGTDWLNSLSNLGPGQSAAPGTMAAISMAADVLFTLQHHVRRLAPAAAHAAAAAIPGSRGRLPEGLPATDVPTPKLVEHLADLVTVWNDRPGLADLLRELEHLNRKVLDVVDGYEKVNHTDPCPWCGRTSLVTYMPRPGSPRPIRVACEGTHPCECDYEFCECHRHPIRNRHEWIHTRGATHRLDALANLIALRRETALMETRALDALARAINLHQPAWLYPDGTEQDLFVWGLADQAPADHQCPGGRPLDSDDEIAQAGAHVPLKAFCYRAGDVVWHAIPVCATCGDGGRSGEVANAVAWPCPTHIALDPENNHS